MTNKTNLNLRQLRMSKGVSQQELADRINCDRSYISKIENGHANDSVSLNTLLAICEALDVTICEISDSFYESCPYHKKE